MWVSCHEATLETVEGAGDNKGLPYMTPYVVKAEILDAQRSDYRQAAHGRSASLASATARRARR